MNQIQNQKLKIKWKQYSLSFNWHWKLKRKQPQRKSWNISPCAKTCIQLLFPIWSGIMSSSSYKEIAFWILKNKIISHIIWCLYPKIVINNEIQPQLPVTTEKNLLNYSSLAFCLFVCIETHQKCSNLYTKDQVKEHPTSRWLNVSTWFSWFWSSLYSV